MKKILKALAVVFLFMSTLFASNPSYAQNVFGSYLQGMEAARAANYRDFQYSQMIKDQTILNDINAFKATNEWGYLCHAVYYGSAEAAHMLYANDMRCQIFEK
jgi:hypothetical protein